MTATLVRDDVDVVPALPTMLLGPELPRFAGDEYDDVVAHRDSEARCATWALLDGDVERAMWHAQRYEFHDRLVQAVFRRWQRDQDDAAARQAVGA